uniref:Uncharacterized protein n=1 Tax=Psilocybe cubensis TaxID=181762 RepID=A0A8H7XXZ9_PSICU
MAPTTRFGIALLKKLDRNRNGPENQWALVAHPTDFTARDAALYCATECNTTMSGWTILIQRGSVLQTARELHWKLVGILEFDNRNGPDVKMNMTELDQFVRWMDPHMNGCDPSGESGGWSSLKWVIRVLNILHEANKVKIPLPPALMGARIRERADYLVREEFRKKPATGVLVISIYNR